MCSLKKRLCIFIIYKLFIVNKKKTFLIKETYPSCDLEMNKLSYVILMLSLSQQLNICMHKSA